jgi:hypothetical protein
VAHFQVCSTDDVVKLHGVTPLITQNGAIMLNTSVPSTPISGLNVTANLGLDMDTVRPVIPEACSFQLVRSMCVVSRDCTGRDFCLESNVQSPRSSGIPYYEQSRPIRSVGHKG